MVVDGLSGNVKKQKDKKKIKPQRTGTAEYF